MDCMQPSKSDQVPDLNEKAYLTQKSQVPMLNETYLVEGKRQLNNDDSHSRILSNMMEKETLVDNMLPDKQTHICQILFDIVEDQSEVYRRAERAISGLSQSNQWRSGKSDREPGTPLPATNSDRQNQKVGLENLSLKPPNIVAGNVFQDVDCYSKCVPIDQFGI